MRVAVVSALVRLIGVALLAAAAWTVSLTVGLAASGLGLLALAYLPDGNE